MSCEHNERNKTMEVTSALTGDTIRIDPREVNTLAISHHKRDLGFVRMGAFLKECAAIFRTDDPMRTDRLVQVAEFVGDTGGPMGDVL